MGGDEPEWHPGRKLVFELPGADAERKLEVPVAKCVGIIFTA